MGDIYFFLCTALILLRYGQVIRFPFYIYCRPQGTCAFIRMAGIVGQSERYLHQQLQFFCFWVNCDNAYTFFLQLTRWRGPGQTWRVRGNIFVAQIRSETPPDMFLILPLLCSATDTPIFCTSGNNHIPSHTDTVRVCWKQSIFSKKKKMWKRAMQQTVEI